MTVHILAVAAVGSSAFGIGGAQFHAAKAQGGLGADGQHHGTFLADLDPVPILSVLAVLIIVA